jgi:histone deacetylase complex regulatory component SIN3
MVKGNLKRREAVTFVDKVKSQFEHGRKYEEFLNTMRDLKADTFVISSQSLLALLRLTDIQRQP